MSKITTRTLDFKTFTVKIEINEEEEECDEGRMTSEKAASSSVRSVSLKNKYTHTHKITTTK